MKPKTKTPKTKPDQDQLVGSASDKLANLEEVNMSLTADTKAEFLRITGLPNSYKPTLQDVVNHIKLLEVHKKQGEDADKKLKQFKELLAPIAAIYGSSEIDDNGDVTATYCRLPGNYGIVISTTKIARITNAKLLKFGVHPEVIAAINADKEPEQRIAFKEIKANKKKIMVLDDEEDLDLIDARHKAEHGAKY